MSTKASRPHSKSRPAHSQAPKSRPKAQLHARPQAHHHVDARVDSRADSRVDTHSDSHGHGHAHWHAAAGDATGSEALFERLHELMFLFRSRLMQSLRDDPEGLAGMEVKVLRFFSHHPGATQSDLVQHSGRDKGQIARLVKTLIERGLLQPSATVQRRGALELTGAGLSLHQRLQRRRAEQADRIMSVLSSQERTQLDTILTRLQSALAD